MSGVGLLKYNRLEGLWLWC